MGGCEFEPADEACLSYTGDTVVFFVGAYSAASFFDSGVPCCRMQAHLEMYLVEAQWWSPVCRSGFISRSAVVSKIMFYSLALLESCANTVCVGQWHHKLLTWHALLQKTMFSCGWWPSKMLCSACSVRLSLWFCPSAGDRVDKP